jgi:hypothetical protein
MVFRVKIPRFNVIIVQYDAFNNIRIMEGDCINYLILFTFVLDTKAVILHVLFREQKSLVIVWLPFIRF